MALGQRGLGAVAADARVVTDDEVVGRVASGALIVGGRVRLRCLRMAGRAGRLRRGRGLVGVMAVEASRRGCMLGVLGRSLVVATRAVCGDHRRRLVQVVAGRAVDRGVLHDGGQMAFGSGVAVDARGRGAPEPEHVAGQAVGRTGLTAVMRDASFFGVALPADRRTRVLEAVALEVVTGVALRLSAADVKRVPGGVAVLSPGRGNEIGRHSLRSARPEPDQGHNPDHDDHDQQGEPAERASGGPGHRPTP